MKQIPWPPLIESARAPLTVRIRDFILTVAAWLLFGHLMRESVSLAFDYFTYPYFEITREHPIDLAVLSQRLSIFIPPTLLAIGWLLFWGIVNRRRLRRTLRGKIPPHLALAAHAARFALDPEVVEKWREARISTVNFDEANQIASIAPATPESTAAAPSEGS